MWSAAPIPSPRKVRDTRTGFRRPADFSISDHLSDSFGVFKGKTRHRMRIHFDSFAARLVSERQWHPSQKIERLADGTIDLAMDVGPGDELASWVLSFGADAEVLEPAPLRAQVTRALDGARARYADPPARRKR